MLNEKLVSRIFNWKFQSAIEHIDAFVTDSERREIDYLASQFGNCGWAIGGLIGQDIEAIVEGLIGPNEDPIFRASRG